MSHEFELINQYFKPLCFVQKNEVGIGDDGAVLNCPHDQQMVVVTDTLIEGVHFPKNTSPYDIAYKSLAVNLSDLAAMAATPAFFSLALTLPEDKNTQAWLKLFAEGLKDLAGLFNVALIGGDTTKGEQLSITITANGWVSQGGALLRSHAQVGDDIYVSGALGEGGLGLDKVLSATEYATDDVAILKLNRPEPRVSLGLALKDVAKSAIDISDGFLADLTHLLEASHCSAVLNLEAFPLSQPVIDWAHRHHNLLLPLTCGDDYELCFTANPKEANQIQAVSQSLSLPITRVGKIVPEAVERIKIYQKGMLMPITSLEDRKGYQHF